MNNVFLEFREFANLSQTEVSQEIGVTRNCYSMWETGKRKPSPDKADALITLAKSYKFPISYTRIYKKTSNKK